MTPDDFCLMYDGAQVFICMSVGLLVTPKAGCGTTSYGLSFSIVQLLFMTAGTIEKLKFSLMMFLHKAEQMVPPSLETSRVNRKKTKIS